MESKMIEVCDAMLVDITCEYNDRADINAGGPPTLGYCFGVNPDEDKDDLRVFLRSCLKKHGRNFISISFGIQKNFPVDKLWTRDKMEECIRKVSF